MPITWNVFYKCNNVKKENKIQKYIVPKYTRKNVLLWSFDLGKNRRGEIKLRIRFIIRDFPVTLETEAYISFSLTTDFGKHRTSFNFDIIIIILKINMASIQKYQD